MPAIISAVLDAVILLVCTTQVTRSLRSLLVADCCHGRLLCRKHGNLADSSVMLLCLCSAADVPTLLQAPRASAARCSRLSCRS